MNNEINDDMDFYIKQCTKNWSAQFQPPAGARAQLLRTASLRPEKRENRLERFLKVIKFSFFGGRQAIYYDGKWIDGPYAHSYAWSMHIDTNWRLAF